MGGHSRAGYRSWGGFSIIYCYSPLPGGEYIRCNPIPGGRYSAGWNIIVFFFGYVAGIEKGDL